MSEHLNSVESFAQVARLSVHLHVCKSGRPQDGVWTGSRRAIVSWVRMMGAKIDVNSK